MGPKVLKILVALFVTALLLIVGYVSYSRLLKKVPTQPLASKKTVTSQELSTTIADITKPLRESSPSASQIQKMKEELKKQGQQGKSITFKDCEPYPQILKANSDEITFMNDSSKDIKIGGIPVLSKSIKGKESLAFKIEQGLYPYSCEIAGTSSVTPQIRGIIDY